MSLSREESFVEKRLKKDGFTVTRIKEAREYKTPDFLIQRANFKALVEVKQGFSRGRILQTIPETGAHRFDASYAVEDYFSETTTQYKEYCQHNNLGKSLPFIVVFLRPFFMDNELEWSDEPYVHFPEISLILIPKKVHPRDLEIEQMSSEEFHKLINSEHVPLDSQSHWSWTAIKNPHANSPANIKIFTSIGHLKRPFVPKP